MDEDADRRFEDLLASADWEAPLWPEPPEIDEDRSRRRVVTATGGFALGITDQLDWWREYFKRPEGVSEGELEQRGFQLSREDHDRIAALFPEAQRPYAALATEHAVLRYRQERDQGFHEPVTKKKEKAELKELRRWVEPLRRLAVLDGLTEEIRPRELSDSARGLLSGHEFLPLEVEKLEDLRPVLMATLSRLSTLQVQELYDWLPDLTAALSRLGDLPRRAVAAVDAIALKEGSTGRRREILARRLGYRLGLVWKTFDGGALPRSQSNAPSDSDEWWRFRAYIRSVLGPICGLDGERIAREVSKLKLNPLDKIPSPPPT